MLQEAAEPTPEGQLRGVARHLLLVGHAKSAH